MTINRDMRSFIEWVKKNHPREHVTVTSEVSPDWEIAGVTQKFANKMRAPILEFSSVSGTSMPIVTNVCASMSRIAKYLDTSLGELEDKVAEAYQMPIPPVIWQRSSVPPVRECIYRGVELNLYSLPQLRNTATETAGYLSAAAVVAYDPDSAAHNISFHRLMIVDRCRTAIYMTPGGHLDTIFKKNAARNRGTPISVFIGGHPLWSLGSLAGGALELDEMSIIGGLLGEPLQVTPGLIDSKLLVPACAEIVLEGNLNHNETVEEGPYGEALGFVSKSESRPIFEVVAMTTRTSPIFQEIVAGQMEHLNMTGVAVKAQLQISIVDYYPSIDEIYQPAPMTVYIRLSEKVGDADIKEIMREVLIKQRYLKQVVVFDHHISLRNPQQTNWALATMVQADKDIIVLPLQNGNGIDPSEQNGQTTKWGIDATAVKDYRSAPVRNEIPESVVDNINLEELSN